MNRNFALSLVIAAAAGSAFAQEITAEPTPFQPSATRATVQSELAAYQRSGIDRRSELYNPLGGFSSSLTRAQVQAELKASRDEVATVGGELGASAQNFARRDRVAHHQLAGQPRNPQ